MRFVSPNLLRIFGVVALVTLAGCASGGTGPGSVFSGAHEGYIHGYPTSKGPKQDGGTFVDANEIRYISGPARVIGYFNSVMYCTDGPYVQGFDHSTIYAGHRCNAEGHGHATIYVRDGAIGRVDEGAQMFVCPASNGASIKDWDTSKCVKTH